MPLYWMDLAGTAVFAVTGVLAAGRRRLDLFGVLVIALVAAVGGGTTRDLLLGVRPVFWLRDPAYGLVVISAAVLTFSYARFWKPPRRALLVADAIGLGVFTVIGTTAAWSAGVGAFNSVLLGVLTTIGGGMIRDVLCLRVPLVMRREIYATAALAGALVFVLMRGLHLAEWAAAPAAASITIVIRLMALRYRWSLPRFLQWRPQVRKRRHLLS